MLDRYGQLDAETFDYEGRFGSAEKELPLEVQNPDIEPVFELNDGPEGYSVFEVETLGDVAIASMTSFNTKTI